MFKAIASFFLIFIVLVSTAGISVLEQMFSSENAQICCVAEESSCCSATPEAEDCCADVSINLHVKFDFAENYEGLKFSSDIFDLVSTNVSWTNQFRKLNNDESEAIHLIYAPPLFKTGVQLIIENQEFLI